MCPQCCLFPTLIFFSLRRRGLVTNPLWWWLVMIMGMACPQEMSGSRQVLLGGVSNWLGDHLEIFHSVSLRGVPFYYCMRVPVNLIIGSAPHPTPLRLAAPHRVSLESTACHHVDSLQWLDRQMRSQHAHRDIRKALFFMSAANKKNLIHFEWLLSMTSRGCWSFRALFSLPKRGRCFELTRMLKLCGSGIGGSE